LPDVVADIVTRRWDHEKTQFSLPPLMCLVSWMIDDEIFLIIIIPFYWLSPRHNYWPATDDIGYVV
jgi:hypothetical protein